MYGTLARDTRMGGPDMYLRIGAVVSGIILAGTIVASDTARANSGCCLKRDSERAPWTEVGRDFAQCNDLNADEGDDVFAPSGLVWWDLDC